MSNTKTARSVAVCLLLGAVSLPIHAQSPDRTKLLGEIGALREQLHQKEQEFLEPDPADRAAYADFLALPDTGIIRILPRETYDETSGRPSALTMRGGGAYYCFADRLHEYGHGSDLGLEQGEFAVGFAGADYGLLVAIGDVPIESVTLSHPAVAYLDGLVTPSLEPEARVMQRKTSAGIQHGDYAYWRRLPATAGTTYAVRSIDYGRYDLLAVFRTIRKDDDGSIVLVWRLLRRYAVPRLSYERRPETIE